MSALAIAVLLGLAIGLPLAAAVYFLFAKSRLDAERAALETERQRSALESQALAQAGREEALKAREVAHAEAETARQELAACLSEAEERKRSAGELRNRAERELERISGMTTEGARIEILARVESEARGEASRRAAEIEQEAVDQAGRRGKQVVLTSLQRLATEYTIEATGAVVQLPSEDIKGRIIGREGRNIRTFEQVTGTDLIIDESPDVVVVSSFDPVRREIARLTLMNLMLDGRIHPGRIEELHEKAAAEVDRVMREAGEEAAARAGVSGLSRAVTDALGRLRFRTSYAQNVLDHSVEVAQLCRLLAEELRLNVEVAQRAGLLHDIGKGLGPEWEGPHALAGMSFLQKSGEGEPVAHAVGAHHNEIEPSTPEAQVVIVADTISASRPGARRESLEQHTKRLGKLEEIANSFPGVERSFAVQAGREIRLIVRPTEVDDQGAAILAKEVARKIESDLEFPGQIKVTVIRETRVQQIAK